MLNEQYKENIEKKVFQEGYELKKQGVKVVGVYCAFTPKELIAASGALPVDLCAGSLEPIATAEKDLPKFLCPLIKASYGHAVEDSCPFFSLSDFIFADMTCDGKKKMFELLKDIKPVYTLALPQTYETELSVELWLNEFYRIQKILEKSTGNKITNEKLEKQIKIYNEFSKAINDLYRLNTGEIPLLYGKEIIYALDGISFQCNLEERIKEIRTIIREIEKRRDDIEFLNKIKNKPKILLTGCPSTNKKLLDILEENGAAVAAMENCGGLKTCGTLVKENSDDPIKALAENYIGIACPCMTPNKKRLELIGEIIKDYKIDGVVELTWQACHTYNVEAYSVKRFVNNEYNLPYMQVETDYSENDIGQIKVRTEAFLEIISNNKNL